MTIREAVQKAKKCLEAHQVPDYEIDALLLLQSVCGIDRARYYACAGEELPDADLYLEKVLLRAGRIPLQQITGEQYFCGLKFIVTEDVLCPRPETELLVEEALKKMKEGGRFLDLCTGSGCIAVSLLCLGKDLTGCGCDLSAAALRIASENAKLHGVTDRLELLQGDLFDAVCGTYDMIVSNPPYIAAGKIDTLMEEVKDHEPRMALDGGMDGLDFYRRILKDAAVHLNPKGWLLMEIGYDQADAVRSMFDEDRYEQVRVLKDLAGLDRVVCGRRSD
jgi:release factor glutamine methyltransferase